MPIDFANQHRTSNPKEQRLPKGALFLTGFVLGFFVCFLFALWYFIPITDSVPVKSGLPLAQPEINTEEMQWDFYEIFPRAVVPLVEEYAETGEKVPVDQFSWALQAGSFLALDDADEMRAKLILLGLDVSIKAVKITGQDHHRVIVGPFNTELARNRAQDQLAQAEIPFLPLKIPR